MALPPAEVPDLPVIDIAPLLEGSPEGAREVARRIGDACRSVGFFYIAGHGVPQSQIDTVCAHSRAFFDLSVREKAALTISRSMNNRGYAGIDDESLDPDAPADLKEAFNVGREPEGDEVIAQGDGNQWPDLPHFRDVMLDYYATMRRLGEELHRAFALDLELPEDFFAASIDRPMATLRLLRYPPAAIDEERPGAGAHTDYGNMTILSQDSTGGLQVRLRDGRWLDAPPIPGTFICNIGDCLMRWSNDIYTSTPHRVFNTGTQVRHSVVFFFDPNTDARIACLPRCATQDRPPRYEPVLAGEYLRQKLDATYAFRKVGDDGP
jgi:isopenicillin N synthase-like dioxygenase